LPSATGLVLSIPRGKAPDTTGPLNQPDLFGLFSGSSGVIEIGGVLNGEIGLEKLMDLRLPFATTVPMSTRGMWDTCAYVAVSSFGFGGFALVVSTYEPLGISEVDALDLCATAVEGNCGTGGAGSFVSCGAGLPRLGEAARNVRSVIDPLLSRRYKPGALVLAPSPTAGETPLRTLAEPVESRRCMRLVCALPTLVGVAGCARIAAPAAAAARDALDDWAFIKAWLAAVWAAGV
jgi:hypothetical protein